MITISTAIVQNARENRVMVEFSLEIAKEIIFNAMDDISSLDVDHGTMQATYAELSSMMDAVKPHPYTFD